MTFTQQIQDIITEAIQLSEHGDIYGALNKRDEAIDDIIDFYYDVKEIIIGASNKLEQNADCDPEYIDIINTAIRAISDKYRRR